VTPADKSIGPNLARQTSAATHSPTTNAAARASGLPTLLSGGIGSQRDIEEAAARRDPLVAGVILGKALYESRLDLSELVRAFPQSPDSAWDRAAAG